MKGKKVKEVLLMEKENGGEILIVNLTKVTGFEFISTGVVKIYFNRQKCSNLSALVSRKIVTKEVLERIVNASLENDQLEDHKPESEARETRSVLFKVGIGGVTKIKNEKGQYVSSQSIEVEDTCHFFMEPYEKFISITILDDNGNKSVISIDGTVPSDTTIKRFFMIAYEKNYSDDLLVFGKSNLPIEKE
jgi:hypothetical protein